MRTRSIHHLGPLLSPSPSLIIDSNLRSTRAPSKAHILAPSAASLKLCRHGKSHPTTPRKSEVAANTVNLTSSDLGIDSITCRSSLRFSHLSLAAIALLAPNAPRAHLPRVARVTRLALTSLTSLTSPISPIPLTPLASPSALDSLLLPRSPALIISLTSLGPHYAHFASTARLAFIALIARFDHLARLIA